MWYAGDGPPTRRDPQTRVWATGRGERRAVAEWDSAWRALCATALAGWLSDLSLRYGPHHFLLLGAQSQQLGWRPVRWASAQQDLRRDQRRGCQAPLPAPLFSAAICASGGQDTHDDTGRRRAPPDLHRNSRGQARPSGAMRWTVRILSLPAGLPHRDPRSALIPQVASRVTVRPLCGI